MPVDKMRLGPEGPLVPPLAVGTMYFGTLVPPETAKGILDAALDAGATFLDTANNYAFWAGGGTGDESESVIGDWFAARPGARDRVTLATKVGARPRPGTRSLEHPLGLTASAVRDQVDGSLRRLRADHIDVLYAHIDDRHAPIEDTVGALQEEVRRGAARTIACSNISADRLAAALRVSGSGMRYQAVQQRFTYLTPLPEADLSPHVLLDEPLAGIASSEGLAMVGYSPLLGGAYTRPDRVVPDAYLHAGTAAQLAVLSSAAEASGLDAGQTVLSWMISREVPVIPVVGVSDPVQLLAAVDAVSTRLPHELLAELEAARGSTT